MKSNKMKCKTCAENKRLRDIICRASTKFCNYAQVQVTRGTRFAILGEASKSNAQTEPRHE